MNDKYILDTKDGKKYQIHYIHSDLGRFQMKISNSENGDVYDDIDAIEDDMCKLIGASYVVCVDTGASIIVPKAVLENSVLIISRYDE